MKAAVISTGPHDFGAFAWVTGAMETDIIAWANVMTANKRGATPGMAYIKKQPETLKPVFDSVPFVNDVVTNNDVAKPLWEAMDQHAALEKANLPILQFTGWHDGVLLMITQQHAALVIRGVPASLTIGPWSHLGAQSKDLAQGCEFIEQHVSGRGKYTDRERWVDFQVRSPEPTPNTGLPRPFDDVLPANYNDTALAQRVVAFTSHTVHGDIEICGQPSIELHHSSDNPHVDILVHLSVIDSKEKSIHISNVYRRLDPTRGTGPLNLALSDCAHVFSQSSGFRLIIAGGAHPAYVRNLGAGREPGDREDDVANVPYCTPFSIQAIEIGPSTDSLNQFWRRVEFNT